MANKKLKIGVVGCGAIGSSLARSIISDFSRSAVLSGVFDTNTGKARALAKVSGRRGMVFSDLGALIKRSDLVIEATQAASSFGIAKKALMSSRSVMIMSVGGIISKYNELGSMADRKGARVFIPSGAIAGIDALKAASIGKVRKVTLTTTKPAKAFSGVRYLIDKGIRPERFTKDTVIFSGSALEATKAFPQNINVAATLSLAGIGPKKTIVKIVASNKKSVNSHTVEIESDSGKVICTTENIIHPANPKTSYLAVLSGLAMLRQILDPIKVGT